MIKTDLIYTQVELPSLHLEWERGDGEKIVSSAIRTNYPKPGHCYILPIAKKAGWKVNAIDMKIRDQEIIQSYREFNYGDGKMIASRMGVPFEKLETILLETNVLGLSVNPTSWSNMALDLMEFAKKINPKIITIIGGNEAIFRYSYYLNKGFTDFAVTGEAENSLPFLLNAIRDNTGFSNVPGISYRGINGIKVTPHAQKPNMDDVHFPALDLLKEDLSLWATPIEYFPFPKGVSSPIGFAFFTRGCYQSCDYCTSPKKMGKFRYKSIENISKELDWFKENGITTLNIWDDSLSSVMYPGALGRSKGREYIMNIASILREKGFAYELSQGGLVIKDLWDTEKKSPDFELIKSFYFGEHRPDGKFIGFYGQYYPLECLQVKNPGDRYSKLMSLEKEKEVLDAILRVKGEKSISFASIVGTPDDTKEGFNLAIKRSKELIHFIENRKGNALATPFIFSAFPGAGLWEKTLGKIKYDINKFPELFQLNTSVLDTDNFKAHEITLAKKTMERELLTREQFENWNQTGRYMWKNQKKSNTSF